MTAQHKLESSKKETQKRKMPSKMCLEDIFLISCQWRRNQPIEGDVITELVILRSLGEGGKRGQDQVLKESREKYRWSGN